MPSLTRAEAETRARLITVSDTVVDLDLTAETDTFASTTTITFACARDAEDTFCDVKAVTIEVAELNGLPVDLGPWTDGRLPVTGLRAGSNVLTVRATMAYAHDGEGLHRHIAPDGRRYLYAMSFLDGGPKWFASFDQPDLKSPYTFTVLAPPEWLVRGNGPAERVGTSTALDGEGVRWRLHQPVPLSTYFVTLLAGPYAEVRDEHDGIPLGCYARADLAEELTAQAPDILAVTKACFDAYHELFGVRYPFGEYLQAFVPDFNAGAMENPGCITFRDQYLFRGAATRAELGGRACTIAHEMAHMWFGDLVTMRWWDDLWLNESFAEFMARLVCSRATPYQQWLDFGISRKDWGMLADQSSSTHPVAGNGSADAAAALQQFDGISYAKGAAALRQLASYTGEEIFFAGLRDYFACYGRGNAEFADLLRCWARAGAVDIESWAAAWLRTSGLDELHGRTSSPGTARIVRVGPDDQAGSDEHPPRPHITTAVRLAADGAVRGEAAVRLLTDEIDLALPGEGGLIVPDAHDQTWARLSLDWAQVPPIGAVDDPRTRLVLHNALRDGVRHAMLDPARAVDLLLAALPAEPEVDFVAAMGGFLTGPLCGSYCRPAERAARRAAVSATLTDWLAATESGSDLQLAALRLAITVSDDVAGLAGWLDGRLPPGVALDRELRWSIGTRLVSLTGDRGVIERCLAEDHSSAGLVHAARARAGIPTTEAKDAAFDALVTDTGASSYEEYAVAEGFFLSHQHELTAPFVERYFAEIDSTRHFRQGWALAQVAALAFPHTHVSAAAVSAARAVIDAPATHPAIRRSVADGADQLHRALSSLERFQ